VGDNIFLVEERVQRLADRLKKWVALRRTPVQVRTPPPPVGSTSYVVLFRGPGSCYLLHGGVRMVTDSVQSTGPQSGHPAVQLSPWGGRHGYGGTAERTSQPGKDTGSAASAGLRCGHWRRH
jgi:hypothetical protein